jgi:hypothetical protein
VRGRSEYRVKLTACFTFTIDDTIQARAGLNKLELEEAIDREWWWLSGSTDVLLESSWELDRFKELPAAEAP